MTTKTGAWFAYLSFAGFFAMSIDSILHGGSERYRDLIIVLPLIGFAGALTALHRVQGERAGRLERPVYLVNMAAVGLLLIGEGIQLFVDAGDARPLFMLPALGWIIGNTAYGVVTIRAKVFPPVVGALLTAAQPATMALGLLLKPIAGLHDFGNYSGALANAIAFGALGVALATYRHRSTA
jgi:hypothetical protein